MKHLFSVLFFVGWFFGVQVPHQLHQGVVVTTIVGAFQDKATCEDARREMAEFLSSRGLQHNIAPRCIERQGA